MKLLFDQNLSYRLSERLKDLFPGSNQTGRLGLENAVDQTIHSFAKQHSFTIVTLDSDFAELAALHGAPPKVIWLKCGNQPNAVVEALLRGRFLLIEAFLLDPESSCLEIY